MAPRLLLLEHPADLEDLEVQADLAVQVDLPPESLLLRGALADRADQEGQVVPEVPADLADQPVSERSLCEKCVFNRRDQQTLRSAL